MAGLISYEGWGDITEHVNRMLMMAQLPPVPSENAVRQDSDAGLARNLLFNTIRSVAQRGWWFNQRYRQTIQADGGGSIISSSWVYIRESAPIPGDAAQPSLRLEYIDTTDGAINALVIDSQTGSSTFEPFATFVVDVIEVPNPNNTPQEFLEYCIYKAGRQFAAMFGIQVDPRDEDEARTQLEKTEANLMVTPNRNCNIEILQQVIR